MSAAPAPLFQRDAAAVLAARLGEPRRFLQVVAGPRQAGKTTLLQQVLAEFGRPDIFVSADEPALRDAVWLAAQWERARLLAKDAGRRGAVLALDEVQKVPVGRRRSNASGTKTPAPACRCAWRCPARRRCSCSVGCPLRDPAPAALVLR